ncbi:hypothetical protein LCGC14_1395710 [marine sediment metagenome]|uniref:Phage major capsid protein, HK97 family n=2 Tax=root TaxID=1 RepID=A0A831QUA8_9FLAO|nr:hypothetical protein [Pricia sp.]HEA22747.1 hypothetical protein [Pricia antarctica]
MPTVNVNNQAYQGEPGVIVTAALNEARTIKQGLVSFAPNVRTKFNIPSLTDEGGFVDAACGWNSAGTITLDNKGIVIKRIMKQREVCKETFIAAHNTEGEILEAIMEQQVLKAAEKFDKDIWIGDNTTSGDFGGLIPLFEADSTVIKPTASGNAVTEANVTAELKTAIAGIPSQIRLKSDLKVVVSSNVALAYENFQIEKGINALADASDRGTRFSRYNVTEMPYLEDNTIIIYQSANVWTISDVNNPENEVRAVDKDVTDLDGMVRAKTLFGGGTGYAHGSEIVYYVSA